MRHQLVGYVLGSLDESEHKRVEKQLADQPQLEKELELVRRSVEPLGADAVPFEPPEGLADRTCDLVDIHRSARNVSRRDTATSAATDAGLSDFGSIPSPGRWSLADVAVAAGIVIAASLLIFPAISHGRFNAQVVACQHNLQTIGVALQGYSQGSEGTIPSIPQSGPLSVASVYAPKLIEAGLISDPSVFYCSPTAMTDEECASPIPSWRQLEELAQAGDDDLDRTLNQCGGSYAYDLGYMKDGVYHTRSLGDRCSSHQVLMADSACPMRQGSQSSNHSGDGQNVLYEDGRVDYLTSNRSPGGEDRDFYRNDDGRVAAGRHMGDTVVGHGAACPTGVSQ